jgi:hypothetical protein
VAGLNSAIQNTVLDSTTGIHQSQVVITAVHVDTIRCSCDRLFIYCRTLLINLRVLERTFDPERSILTRG